MLALHVTSLLSLLPLTLAAPAPPLTPPSFYLVTSTQKEATTPSSSLTHVSALSLFAPYSQPTLFIRTISAGYGSLPAFTLSAGRLHTSAAGPHGSGPFLYNSTDVADGGELALRAEPESAEGALGLYEGYLLTQEGGCEGWTVCPGDLGQSVIKWKGAAQGCTATYLHAVAEAPY